MVARLLACLILGYGAVARADDTTTAKPAKVEVDLVLLQVDRHLLPRHALSLPPGSPSVTTTLDAKEALQKLEALRNTKGVQVRAEVKLMATDGRSSRYHQGGHVAIPQESADGQIEVEMIPYGTMVDVAPTLQADGKIYLDVDWEHSEIDEANGGVVHGFQVPGQCAQRMRAAVTLEKGQTLVMGGMMYYESVKVDGAFDSHEMETVAIITARNVDGEPRACSAPATAAVAEWEPPARTTRNLNPLQRAIAEAAPGSSVRAIPGVGETVILCGSVSSAEDVPMVMKLAADTGLLPINALRIGSVEQVQLDVVLCQVDRKALRRHPDWRRAYEERLRQLPTANAAERQEWHTLMRNLQELGAVRVLAEPHLATLMGRACTYVSASGVWLTFEPCFNLAGTIDLNVLTFEPCFNLAGTIDLNADLEFDGHRSAHDFTLEDGETAVVTAAGDKVVLATVYLCKPE